MIFRLMGVAVSIPALMVVTNTGVMVVIVAMCPGVEPTLGMYMRTVAIPVHVQEHRWPRHEQREAEGRDCTCGDKGPARVDHERLRILLISDGQTRTQGDEVTPLAGDSFVGPPRTVAA